MLDQEKRLTLDEIIELTGHARMTGAYHALRRAGVEPAGYRPMPGKKGGPMVEYRESDVRRVFGNRIGK